MCATWVSQIIGAVPGIQHGESRVTTVGPYSPNVAMSIVLTEVLVLLRTIYVLSYLILFNPVKGALLSKRRLKGQPIIIMNGTIDKNPEIVMNFFSDLCPYFRKLVSYSI